PISSTLNNGDYMMLQQNSMGAVTGRIQFQQVGFVAGTKMWFYQNAVPSTSWEIIAVQDALLAIKSNTGTYSTAGAVAGTWQQADHTLTIAQMPTHTHQITMLYPSNSKCINPAGAANEGATLGFYNPSPQGGNQPHNHGSAWRPLAAVGILCNKVN